MRTTNTLNRLKGGTLFLIGMLIWSSNAPAKGLYGIRISGSTVVFLMDVSPSMEGTHEEVHWIIETTDLEDAAARRGAGQLDDATGTPAGSLIYEIFIQGKRESSKKLTKAKKELSKAIKSMDSATRFNIALFSDDLVFWSGKPELADKDNKSDAREFIKYATTSPNTNIGMALEGAFEVEGVDEIFLITDGEPTDNSPAEILKQFAEMNKDEGVRVNTVGLGEIKDDTFLKKLASQNGGRYVYKKK